MTKIAIISQAEQGVLIDIGGCDTLNEAAQHLSSTFQVTNEFWENQNVDLNLGKLRLSKDELSQIIAILAERGVKARQWFSEEESTQEVLKSLVPPPPPPAEGLGSWGEGNATTAGATAEGAPGEKPVGATAEGAPGETREAQASLAHESETSTTDETPTTPPVAPPAPAVPHVLYLRQTLRSGQSVSHKGNLIIIGDVNPGAEVSAEGDITIWGALRGIAHAGTAGNTNAEIRALKFDPIQLRIAHAIARAPDRPRGAMRSAGPETARIVNGTIRISSSAPE